MDKEAAQSLISRLNEIEEEIELRASAQINGNKIDLLYQSRRNLKKVKAPLHQIIEIEGKRKR